ncbi:MAG: glycoside hydrolase family 25 protein [Dysgonomonas sp.]
MKQKQLKQLKKAAILFTFLLFVVAGVFLLVKKLRTSFDSFEDGGFSDKYVVRGIDLSHHNPIIDWNAAVAQNITFAYIKATEGSDHEDRNYVYNYDQAKRSGVRVGSYHFYIFGSSGSAQARHFIKTAKCASGDLIPAIDVEHSPANIYTRDTAFFALVIKELKILEKELWDNYGVHPVIYTNKDCYKLYVKDYFPNNPIWMCDLHNEPSDSDVKNWMIWQFSHKGRIANRDDDIDLNYFRYSFADLKKYTLP